MNTKKNSGIKILFNIKIMTIETSKNLELNLDNYEY